MAICNTFKKLTKETGTFLTFGQYMDDLTEWQTKSKYHKIVPSKFIAIDDQNKYYKDGVQYGFYNNLTLPSFFHDFFENGCACFKNNPDISWTPDYAKILFWNAMFESNIIKTKDVNDVDFNVEGIKYVGDINIQSYNEVDGMGYSEIYCNIPNEAPSYIYSMNRGETINSQSILRRHKDLLEGFQDGELNGIERADFVSPTNSDGNYQYTLDRHYKFSWDHKDMVTKKTDETQYNVDVIILLYDIWNDNEILYSGVPLGIYITGLVNNNGVIQNSITKYVANEDIYNSGTSYGIRICSRYVVSAAEDNYVIKEITCENNNNSELSKVLTQLSISQNKMDDIVNKKYNVDQNYKQLLSIFKNSRTNTPYIKQVNDSNYWYINGKMIGPSIDTEGIFEPYTITELEEIYNTRRIQAFLININIFDSNGDVRHIYERGTTENITIKWNVNYNGINIRPAYFMMSTNNGSLYEDLTNLNQCSTSISKDTNYLFKAGYANYNDFKEVRVKFVDPIYFGELPENCGISESLGHDKVIDGKTTGDIIVKNFEDKNLQKYLTDTCVGSYEITTKEQYEPGHICYAYPESLGYLSFIVDDNGYVLYKNSSNDEVLKDNRYVRKIIQINGINYIAYIEKEPAVRTKQKLYFEMLEKEENK